MAILAILAMHAAPQEPLYPALAQRAVASMRPTQGERVLIRRDAETMAGFEPVLRTAFERAGAQVETIGTDVDRFEERLARTDIYVWMPGASAITTGDERKALERWADRGGTRRELHFHWSEGTLTLDRMNAPHTAEMDQMYADALAIDYAALDKAQEAAIALLRSGEIRVTTPAGTDLRFRTGDRPFNKQNGDGSKERMRTARVRIDRHVELPAGILRVAPLESTVRGVLVIPTMRYGPGFAAVARNVRLEIVAGKVVKVDARDQTAVIEGVLRNDPALAHFRELGVGFNPKLVMSPGSSTVPYYGYGAGVVRLSLGDNEELGGAVRGGSVAWHFFPDATITVGRRPFIKGGKLAGQNRRSPVTALVTTRDRSRASSVGEDFDTRSRVSRRRGR